MNITKISLAKLSGFTVLGVISSVQAVEEIRRGFGDNSRIIFVSSP